ncbi:hypothetical protein Q8A73_022288 [Channa argus]|nr:hypothetical protein Q8A73_022288 [Channa argus]
MSSWCQLVSRCAYSREVLLDVGRTTKLNSAHPELRELGLLRRPTPSLTPTTIHCPQRRCHQRRQRKQKRGKRRGIRARLTANPHKPAIPTILLANVRSLDIKLDYIRLLRSTQRTGSRRGFPKASRSGLCVYTSDAWCHDAVVICKHCSPRSPLVEFMIIKCQPFYLPGEYRAILLRGAYKALPLPNLGASDHITVMLMPAYKPLVKVAKPVKKQIKVWPEGKTWNAAFRAGDEVGLRTARANLSRGIREVKRQYSRRIAHQFSNSRDTRSLWQGIQTITDYRPPPQTCKSNISLLNEVNAFFAWFEKQNSSTAQKTPPPPGDQVLTLTPDSVRRSFSKINARKATGPDNILRRVLRDCAAELTNVFTGIFNISLRQAVVPTCFKATIIIPVQKKPSPSCFNDYRPVALTPIIMKCFERLVMHHIKSALPPSLDPSQFAYRSNSSTDDAVATAVHSHI